MRDEPGDLTTELVADALRVHWGLAPDTVSYAPVGFGSYHWIAADRHGPRWFVTADYLAPEGSWVGPTPELAFAALCGAAGATRELAGRGFDFVLAPLPDRTGTLIRRVLPDWCMQVFPYLAGSSTNYGEWTDPAEQARIAGIVGRLHTAAPPAGLRRWDFTVPGRQRLMSALDDLDRPWSGGPYAEPARQLLGETDASIRDRFRHYDALAAEIAADPEPFVVSHGEPHSGNVIRTDDGRMYLIDWDTVRLAPRERDLATILAGPADVLPAYQREAGRVRPRPAALELFRLWWALAEVCGYVQLFRRPHTDGADSVESWRNLQHYASAEPGEATDPGGAIDQWRRGRHCREG